MECLGILGTWGISNPAKATKPTLAQAWNFGFRNIKCDG